MIYSEVNDISFVVYLFYLKDVSAEEPVISQLTISKGWLNWSEKNSCGMVVPNKQTHLIEPNMKVQAKCSHCLLSIAAQYRQPIKKIISFVSSENITFIYRAFQV